MRNVIRIMLDAVHQSQSHGSGLSLFLTDASRESGADLTGTAATRGMSGEGACL